MIDLQKLMDWQKEDFYRREFKVESILDKVRIWVYDGKLFEGAYLDSTDDFEGFSEKLVEQRELEELKRLQEKYNNK